MGKEFIVLHINSNRLSGNIPMSLQNCKNLEILDLSRNNLSGKVPEWIGDLSKLRILDLRSNNFEGEIPIQIRYLQKLQILDLAMNHLSGSIPQQLSNLSRMTDEDFTRSTSSGLTYGPYHRDVVDLMDRGQELAYTFTDLRTDTSMDLSGNCLTGDIPEDIGYLKGLRTLNLSHNHFTGHIPQEFGNMVDLETLDMSCNQLDGKIPIALADLNSLGWLNLSSNKLSGRIPNGRHFDTFEATSFSGNPELCGLPLATNCSEYSGGEGDDSDKTVHWWESWEVGFGYGWAIGFGGVIGALVHIYSSTG
jgi:Leucine-rich repeat (LRR) protein